MKLLTSNGYRDNCFRSVVIAMSVLISCGCQPSEPIATQRVPKDESGYLIHRQTPLTPSTSIAQAPSTLKPEEMTDRMLVAIYPLEKAMWFAKVNGSLEQLKSVETELIKFFESIDFSDGSPKWVLPENWSLGEERPMRFATVRIDKSTPPLEVAISNLPAPQDLTLNVNRWRGQMGLAPITADELTTTTRPLQSKIDRALLFDANGKFGGGMMGAPMAGLTGSGTEPPRLQPTRQPDSSTSVEATTPEGWSPGPTSSMVPIRYQKSVEGKSGQITIIPLPAAANEWEPNLTRWAGEVDLLDLKPEDLRQRTSTVDIDGVSGNLVRLIPEDERKSKATIGVMAKKGDVAWFVKLSGDRNLVAESETAFLNFLKTIKLPAER